MITQFKIFENLKSELKVGDYVLMRSNASAKELLEFINNNIGQVIKINNFEDLRIRVRYNNIPDNVIPWFGFAERQFPPSIRTAARIFDINQIVEFAKTKEELELKLAAKKYNL